LLRLVAVLTIAAVKQVILSPGEKVHIIHRRLFEHDPHRHFVGTVEAYDAGVVRVTGHVYAVDPMTFQFVRRADLRTRIVSAVSGEVIINVIPSSVKLDKVRYRQEANGLRVTDGSDWHIDISEITWR
jgi:hypothetical protein